MRVFSASVLVLGLSALGAACADSVPGEGVGLNRGALGGAPSNPALDAVGGRYIVKFRDVGAGKAALTAAGASIALELGPQGAAAAHIPPQALEALTRNPHIEYIEEDVIRKPFAQTVPYGIGLVQADLVADPSAANRKVCIIDSGYSRVHEDLQDLGVNGTNNSGTGNWFEDTCGHGSHVAGTIAALDNNAGVVGVIGNGNVNLHIIKVFNGADCGWAYSSSLVSALNACVSAGANVINMSLGGGTKSRTEESAFNNAYANGVLSIAAAGNDGTSTGSTDPVNYPAGYASVVSVAALDSASRHATFSQENSSVEIAAPGVGVLSTVPFLDTAAVTVNGTTYNGHPVELAATGNVSGGLVNGGLCGTSGAWTGKVVLCQRGTYSFYDKVINAQNGGAVGVIISNNVANEELYATLSTGSSSIPAIGVTLEQGNALLAAVGATANLVNQSLLPANGYEAWDGTSMATPHVTGVAALLWSHFPACSNAEIREALTATALDLGAAGRDISYGYGLVQALDAYDYLELGCGAGGGGGGGGDVTAPIISDVRHTVTNSKNGSFKITWTTDEASNSQVTFSTGTTSTDSAMVTSHSMSFRGTKGASYTVTVSSTDAAGNKASAPYSFTLPR